MARKKLNILSIPSFAEVEHERAQQAKLDEGLAKDHHDRHGDEPKPKAPRARGKAT